jgi:hypothetical protein
VSPRLANIALTKTVKYKRNYFPVVPACSVSIHKSQGGTFHHFAYKYDKKQQNQLVYGALNRDTTLEVLYLVNEKDDFTFYHGYVCNTPTTQDIETEYKRLEQHRLRTLTSRVETFLQHSDVSGYNTKMIIVNIIMQSLKLTRVISRPIPYCRNSITLRAARCE